MAILARLFRMDLPRLYYRDDGSRYRQSAFGLNLQLPKRRAYEGRSLLTSHEVAESHAQTKQEGAGAEQHGPPLKGVCDRRTRSNRVPKVRSRDGVWRDGRASGLDAFLDGLSLLEHPLTLASLPMLCKAAVLDW